MNLFSFARRRPWLSGLGVVIALIACVPIYERITGTSIFVKHGSSLWLSADANTPWLPAPMRRALRGPPPQATPGAMEWRTVAAGFDVAELPALVDGAEADRLFLARVDPTKFRFIVRTDPSGRHNLDGWMRNTGAALVINGSYFGRNGGPSTPVVIDGALQGPSDYTSSHAAFVSSSASTGIADLAGQDWRAALSGADTAMVSFPVLVAADGSSRAPRNTGWLANRSFVGEDRQGRIILGTTASGFFSLDRFSDFLRAAPLDLKMALNLDGGPVACQGVALGGYARRLCGAWELQVDANGRAKVLPHVPGAQSPMPIVLAVMAR